MRRRPYKLSVLGDWQSGRSSVVAVLSGKPCPNHPGIQVTRWTEPATGLPFEIWDVNSRTALEALGQIFINGSEALVAVADSRGAESIRAAQLSLQAALQLLGPCPAVLLLNKCDLLDDAPPVVEVGPGVRVYSVSAVNGEGVLPAFRYVADELLRE